VRFLQISSLQSASVSSDTHNKHNVSRGVRFTDTYESFSLYQRVTHTH